MDSKKIVIGMAAMENFAISYRPLIGKGYEFHTTAFVKNGSPQYSTDGIHIKEFDATEVAICMDYIAQNDLESKVGINDGTAIYYAMSSNMTLLTTNHTAEMVCNTLGVSYVNNDYLKRICVADSTWQTTRKNDSINLIEDKVVRLYASGTPLSSYKTNICL